jgi:hypothetical protein
MGVVQSGGAIAIVTDGLIELANCTFLHNSAGKVKTPHLNHHFVD